MVQHIPARHARKSHARRSTPVKTNGASHPRGQTGRTRRFDTAGDNSEGRRHPRRCTLCAVRIFADRREQCRSTTKRLFPFEIIDHRREQFVIFFSSNLKTPLTFSLDKAYILFFVARFFLCYLTGEFRFLKDYIYKLKNFVTLREKYLVFVIIEW